MVHRSGFSHYKAAHRDEVVYQARYLWECGMSYEAIAEKLGVNRNTVADWNQLKNRVNLKLRER